MGPGIFALSLFSYCILSRIMHSYSLGLILDFVSSSKMHLILFGFEDPHLEFAIIFSTRKYFVCCINTGGKKVALISALLECCWVENTWTTLLPLHVPANAKWSSHEETQGQLPCLESDLCSSQPCDCGQLALTFLRVIFFFWNVSINMICG